MSTWSGRTVTRARAYWRKRLPLPCWRCGRPVTDDQAWHVGHLTDRALGGHTTDRSNQWPEHARCNTSAGGKLGAAIAHARHDLPRMAAEASRGIRGI